jgi:hypothetical protein
MEIIQPNALPLKEKRDKVADNTLFVVCSFQRLTFLFVTLKKSLTNTMIIRQYSEVNVLSLEGWDVSITSRFIHLAQR